MPNITYGQNFNITATIVSSNLRLTPTGVVVFKDGSGRWTNIIGTGALQTIGAGIVSATIIVSSSVLGRGIHNIIGYYAGDDNFDAASSTPEIEDII